MCVSHVRHAACGANTGQVYDVPDYRALATARCAYQSSDLAFFKGGREVLHELRT
jgi:hypothetical protein